MPSICTPRTILTSKAFRRPPAWTAWGLASLIALAAACGDDDTPGPPGKGRKLSIPGDIATIEEALAQALPGDSLFVDLVLAEPFSATVVVESSQTPFYIGGTKSRPLVLAPASGGAAVVFRNPRAGTTVASLAFRGGDPAISAEGSGQLTIRDCSFRDGDIHVRAGGNELTLLAEGNLMVSPSLFGFVVTNRAVLRAHRNTVVDAGDCGVLATASAQLELTANIVARSANFGVACQTGSVLRPLSGCNDVFQSGTLPYQDCDEPPTDFGQDPLFCDEAGGNYSLDVLSPCAPLNSGGCGVVGAFGVACEPGLEKSGR